MNRTIRHKPTAISTSSDNLLGQHYNVQCNVAISAQQLVAKHNNSTVTCYTNVRTARTDTVNQRSPFGAVARQSRAAVNLFSSSNILRRCWDAISIVSIKTSPKLSPLMLSLGSRSSLAVCRSRTYLNLAVPRLTKWTPALPRTPAIVPATLHRNTSTKSSAPGDPKEYIGQSGCHYSIERVLQEKTSPLRRIYSATQVNLITRYNLRAYCFLSANNQKFILKYVHEGDFTYLLDINNRLRCIANHVRLVKDAIPEKSMFVFQYFDGHLLRLALKDLPIAVTKQILKDALRGIAELHDQDIVHTGSFHPSAQQ